jgi:glycine/D-amino acid oxidase-like deaminating enzyme
MQGVFRKYLNDNFGLQQAQGFVILLDVSPLKVYFIQMNNIDNNRHLSDPHSENNMSFIPNETNPIPKCYQVQDQTEFEREELVEKIQADAVVIGSGVTGNSLSVHLTEAGKSVVQLEAKVPGWGGSGRAFGSVVPYHKNSEEAIIRHYGWNRGAKLIDSLSQGPALVGELIKRHSIPNAAFDSGGWANGCHTKSFEKKMQKRADYWQSRGHDVQYLNASEFAQLIGSEYYRAGILDKRAMSINPLAYAQGLYKTAQSLGSRQYTNSPAVNVQQQQSGSWVVTTPKGSVECENLYFCTNAYSKGVWPRLDKGFVPVRGWGATTTPIAPDVLANILPGNHFITDTRQLWSGLRRLPSGQIHMGIGGPSMGLNGRGDIKEAQERLLEIYPEIKSVEWSEDWSGWIAVSTDQFPRILRLADGVWAAQGYSGRGLALGTLMGRELSMCQGDTARDDLMLPVEKIPYVPFHMFSPLGAAAVIKWYDWEDAKDLRKK